MVLGQFFFSFSRSSFLGEKVLKLVPARLEKNTQCASPQPIAISFSTGTNE